MEKLYGKMANLDCKLTNYLEKCQRYWEGESKWEPKAKDLFWFANAFKKLATYKAQNSLSLEENHELGQIHSMMSVASALIETCALKFPHCNIEDDFWDAQETLIFWLEGSDEEFLWDKSYAEDVFERHRDALARVEGATE